MLTIDRQAVQYLVADTQQSSAHTAHFNSAVYIPGRISEKPLHPSGRPRNRLRQVLSVAPLPGLYQQGLEITAVLPRLPAAKQRAK